MDRRRFILTSLAGTLAAPHPAEALQAAPYRIGFLHPSSPSAVVDATYAEVFRDALRALGYVEGQNVTIDFRWAEGHPERLPALAADLVRREVAVIVAPNNPAIFAARQATAAIPIVMVIGVDPIGQGFISGFARPGANVTGLTWSQGPRSPERTWSC